MKTSILYIFILFLFFTSCKKMLYETTANITLVDITTKKPIANADVYLLNRDNTSWSGPQNTSVVTHYKTNNLGKCTFVFTPDEYGWFEIAAEADGYYEEDDFDNGIIQNIGKVNDMILEMHPEAFLKVFIKNTNPYNGNDRLFLDDYGTPSGGGGVFYGMNVDTFTIARTWGNINCDWGYYSVTKNGIKTSYTYNVYCPANDTTIYYINY